MATIMEPGRFNNLPYPQQQPNLQRPNVSAANPAAAFNGRSNTNQNFDDLPETGLAALEFLRRTQSQGGDIMEHVTRLRRELNIRDKTVASIQAARQRSGANAASGSSGNSHLDKAGEAASSSSDTSLNNNMSKTHQYKKIMKPLLERKRRARINKCLDELKDIMTNALQSQGENVSKLEKADILELTVKHMQKLQQTHRLNLGESPSASPALTEGAIVESVHNFKAGYSSCAQEAANFLIRSQVDIRVSQRLLSHLSANVHQQSLNQIGGPGGVNRISPTISPSSTASSSSAQPPALSPPASTSTPMSSLAAFRFKQNPITASALTSTPRLSSSSDTEESDMSCDNLRDRNLSGQALLNRGHSRSLSASDTSSGYVTSNSTPSTSSGFLFDVSKIHSLKREAVSSEDIKIDVDSIDEEDEQQVTPKRSRSGGVLVKPEPIRLNPGDPVWRPF